MTFDKNKYTMLRKYVGSVVEIVAIHSKVSIYNQHGDLLKEYPRSYDSHAWIYDEETMPRSNSDCSYWTPDYFLNKATMIGPSTRSVIEKVLASRPSPNQAFRACFGIVSFKDKYGKEVLEACCSHSLEVNRPNYTFIRDYIKQYKQINASEENDEIKAPDLSSEMKFKVPDHKYSLKKLTAAQEENYDKN